MVNCQAFFAIKNIIIHMEEKQKKTQTIIIQDAAEKAVAEKSAENAVARATEKATERKTLSDEAKAIKERLCSELRHSGLTSVEISAKIGVSPEMVTQYMTTNKMPRLETFARICKELDLSPAYILGVEEY